MRVKLRFKKEFFGFLIKVERKLFIKLEKSLVVIDG